MDRKKCLTKRLVKCQVVYHWVCKFRRGGVVIDWNVKICMVGVTTTSPSWSCKGKQLRQRRRSVHDPLVGRSVWKSGVRANVSAPLLWFCSCTRHGTPLWYLLIFQAHDLSISFSSRYPKKYRSYWETPCLFTISHVKWNRSIYLHFMYVTCTNEIAYL